MPEAPFQAETTIRDYTRIYIDGAWVEPLDGKIVDMINPASERPAGLVPIEGFVIEYHRWDATVGKRANDATMHMGRPACSIVASGGKLTVTPAEKSEPARTSSQRLSGRFEVGGRVGLARAIAGRMVAFGCSAALFFAGRVLVARLSAQYLNGPRV